MNKCNIEAGYDRSQCAAAEATITQQQQQRVVVKGVEVKGGCGFSPSDLSRIRLICCIRWPGVILTAEVWRLTSPADRSGSCPTRTLSRSCLWLLGCCFFLLHSKQGLKSPLPENDSMTRNICFKANILGPIIELCKIQRDWQIDSRAKKNRFASKLKRSTSHGDK